MKLRGKKLISIVLALTLIISALCSIGYVSAAEEETITYKYVLNCDSLINGLDGEITYPDTLSVKTVTDEYGDEVPSIVVYSEDSSAYAAVKDGKILFNASSIDDKTTDIDESFDFSDGKALVTVEFIVNGDYNAEDIKTTLSEFYSTDVIYDGNIPYKYENTVNDKLVSRGYVDLDNPEGSYDYYVVTFDNDGDKNTVDVECNTVVDEPNTPTKDGYVFDGWYNGDTKFDFTTPITSDLTLTAKWKEKDSLYKGNTVSFKDNLTLNFLATIADENVDDAYVKFTYNHYGEEKTVKVDADRNDKLGNYYRFRCELTASEMAIVVKAELYNDDSGEPVSTYSRSIRDYCIAGLEDDNTPAAEKALLRAALNYGGYTQERFKYNGEPYANEGYKDDVSSVNVKSSITEDRPTGVSEGIEYVGSSVFFKNAPYVRYYFKLAEGSDIDDYTFTLDGSDVTVEKNGSYYYFNAPSVLAYKLDDAQNVVVKKGGTTAFDFNYSVIKWAQLASKDTEYTDDADMSKAMFVYYQAAQAYVNG